MQPNKSPIPIGSKTLKFNEETADKYNSYLPNNNKITVLLIPGITTPADIPKPAKTKEAKEVFVNLYDVKKCSIVTKYKLKDRVSNKAST